MTDKCETCKWFTPNDLEYFGNGGTCDRAVNISLGKVNLAKGGPIFAVADESFPYCGRQENGFSHMHVGPEFGCIHHVPHKETK
jgi:hypothetical protein